MAVAFLPSFPFASFASSFFLPFSGYWDVVLSWRVAELMCHFCDCRVATTTIIFCSLFCFNFCSSFLHWNLHRFFPFWSHKHTFAIDTHTFHLLFTAHKSKFRPGSFLQTGMLLQLFREWLVRQTVVALFKISDWKLFFSFLFNTLMCEKSNMPPGEWWSQFSETWQKECKMQKKSCSLQSSSSLVHFGEFRWRVYMCVCVCV